jgi:hypothetical protein
MQPINSDKRRTAIKKFTGVYVLSLLFPLIAAAFFIFSKPPSKEEKKELLQPASATELSKQAKMLTLFDSLALQSAALQGLDKQTMQLAKDSARGAELQIVGKKIDSIELVLRDRVQAIKDDTSAMEEPRNRTIARTFANAYDALIDYRYNISSMRSMLGPNAKCANELANLKKQKDELAKEMQLTAQDNATKSDSLMKILANDNAQLKAENKSLNADNASFKTSVSNNSNKIADLEEKLKSKPTAASVSPAIVSNNEAEMAELRAMALVAEIDCMLKQADPKSITSDDKQRLKFAHSAFQKLSETERVSNTGLIRNMVKQRKEEYERILNDIKRGKG